MKKIWIALLSLKLFADEKIDLFISNLPPEQKTVLEYFANSLLTCPSSSVGYVLYGDKPMCSAVVDNFAELPTAQIEHADIAGLELRGFEFLADLSIDPKNKKYPVIECNINKSKDFIFINRECFVNTVNKNISLFRYILGTTITAESLLEDLLKSGDRFFETLKWNKLILGLLFGYGTQNALTVSRGEDLKEELNDKRVFFPFARYETFIASQMAPSVGFSNIEQEFAALYTPLKLSTQIKPFDFCRLPHFSCHAVSNETSELLMTYEKNRASILKVVQRGNVLSELLHRLYTTTSDEVIAPSNLMTHIPQAFVKDSKKIADCLAFDQLLSVKQSHFPPNTTEKLILKGAKQREDGAPDPSKDWREESFQVYLLDQIYEKYIELSQAVQYLDEIAKNPEISPVIPSYVYSKTLCSGSGTASTNKIYNATFHYSLYTSKGELVYAGTVKKVGIDSLTAGVAASLIGMKKGEEKQLYIHPYYACELSRPDEPLTIANIKLLDFAEGTQETTLPDPFNIPDELRDDSLTHAFLKKYESFKKDALISQGYHLWDAIKKANLNINLEEFSNLLKSESRTEHFQNEQQRRRYILDYNCYLFHLDYQDGSRPLLMF